MNVSLLEEGLADGLT